MKTILFLFIILALSSCGWSVDDKEPTEGAGLIGQNLTVNLDREFSNTKVSYLKRICSLLSIKDGEYRRDKKTFEFTYSGKDCSKDEITTPKNKAFMKIDGTQFDVLATTTTPRFIKNYESDTNGLLKDLCYQARAVSPRIKVQVKEGRYVDEFDFNDDSTICKSNKSKSICFRHLVAKQNSNGQFPVLEQSLVVISDNTARSIERGIVIRRELYETCGGKDHSSLISTFVSATE